MSESKASFGRKIFPAFYGLLVYFTVRLLQDSQSGVRFWHRDWRITAAELAGSILIGYLMIGLVTRLLRRFDQARSGTGRPPAIGREIGAIALLNLVIQNAVFTPLAAFTDDGLQWGDLAAINVIPLLYTLIYYGYMRSRTWLDAFTDEKVKREKLANDQLSTELQFLRAQYHPHFLFNALNTIYFQMDEDVPGAKKTLEQFSELLRYQLYDQQDKVPLQREIHYLDNYIALQKARNDEMLNLAWHYTDNGLAADVSIYPLLLLPLVENAFKYVGGDFALSISLAVTAQNLQIIVENSLGSSTSVKPGGIGLANLRRRLALLYPGRHRFESGGSGADCWRALLSIDLS